MDGDAGGGGAAAAAAVVAAPPPALVVDGAAVCICESQGLAVTYAICPAATNERRVHAYACSSVALVIYCTAAGTY